MGLSVFAKMDCLRTFCEVVYKNNITKEQMIDILKELNLEPSKDKFISEKITPDIILKLSLTELN